MTFAPGEPGGPARDEFGRPLQSQGYEAPPIEQFGPAGPPGYHTTPGGDPFAPVDYPADYPGPQPFPPIPPPVYPGGYPGPGSGGYPGYPPYGPPAQPGTDGRAIAAVVCGGIGLLLCGCFLPSLAVIVLGILGISETSRTGRPGRGLAITGLVLGAVGVLGGMVVLLAAAVDGG